MAKVENVGLTACVRLGYGHWQRLKRYDSAKPPRLIELWLDKAPMIFLIVAALTFIVGLNLFAYLSSQVCIKASVRSIPFIHTNQARYVSVSTNALTGTHIACLVVAIAWFIYRLKHESRAIRWAEGLLPRWRKGVDVLYKSDRSLHFQRNVCW